MSPYYDFVQWRLRDRFLCQIKISTFTLIINAIRVKLTKDIGQKILIFASHCHSRLGVVRSVVAPESRQGRMQADIKRFWFGVGTTPSGGVIQTAVCNMFADHHLMTFMTSCAQHSFLNLPMGFISLAPHSLRNGSDSLPFLLIPRRRCFHAFRLAAKHFSGCGSFVKAQARKMKKSSTAVIVRAFQPLILCFSSERRRLFEILMVSISG